MPKLPARHHYAYREYLENREYGYRKHRPGLEDRLARTTYRKLVEGELQTPSESFFQQNYTPENPKLKVGPTGGIFNLEFNPDGSLLVAACERRNVLMFDPVSRKLVNSIENAHEDCVNCVRFLDNRSFATCSDDTTVALWDARFVKRRVRTLRGHSNWVKNIEYSFRENLLVTSGFDGAIFTWDINRYSENPQSDYTKVFYTNGLMRMRMAPNAEKMVISTMNGYIMIIHDLSLNEMKTDLNGFKPNLYRLMQLSGKPLPIAASYTHLFHGKRNRVEIISDFAPNNDAEIISSLQLHPQGWVAVSRNTSSDDRSEWCCVHDIHSYATSEEEDVPISTPDPTTSSPQASTSNPPAAPASTPASSSPSSTTSPAVPPSNTGFARLSDFLSGTGPSAPNQLNLTDDEDEEAPPPRRVRPIISINVRPRRGDNQAALRFDEIEGMNLLHADSLTVLEVLGELGGQHAVRDRGNSEPAAPPAPTNPDPTPPPTAAADPRVPPVSPDAGRHPPSPAGSSPSPSRGQLSPSGDSGFLLISPGLGQGGHSRVLYFGSPGMHRQQRQNMPKDAKIHRNIPRLTHFIEESNTGRGFIKEVSFSPDGRVFCSPFGYGIRLLSFNESCSDLSQCAPEPEAPVALYEQGTKMGCHNDVVLASAFAPYSYTLVSGCLAGKIVWHQPVL